MKIVKVNPDKNEGLYHVGNVITDDTEELYIIAKVGKQYAIINLSTGFAAGRKDALFDSEEALEETYSSDEDELVFGEHLVDFNNTSQE